MKLFSSLVTLIRKNSFIQANLWVFLATGFLNVGNFLYHFITARLLGPADYGLLESLISFSYIFAIPLSAIGLVLVKYVSVFHGKKDKENISLLFIWFQKYLFRIAVVLLLLLVIVAPPLLHFLKLPSYTGIFLVALFTLIGLFTVFYRSFIQGMTNFRAMAISNFTEATTKVLLTAVLVIIGFKSDGALGAIVISGIFGIVVMRYFLPFKKSSKKTLSIKKEMFLFTIPVLCTNIALASLISSDIMLVRNLFSAVDAGYYAALALIGKVLYFAVSPVLMVMFPFISQYHAAKQSFTKILLLSFLFTLLPGLILVILFFLFPTYMIIFLPGSTFLPIAPLVGFFGVFMLLYSLCSLLANFYLAIHKSEVSYLLIFAAIMQIGGIWMFHTSLFSVICVSLSVTSILLIVLLLYYFYGKGQTKKNT